MITTLRSTDLNKWLSYGFITINRIWGFNNSTASSDLYILLFQAPTAVANDVPACSPITCVAGTWFDWEHCPQNLSECYLAISTDANSLTAVTAGQGFDISIEYDTDFPVTSDVSLVGDLTTGVASKELWNNAAGPKTLLRLDVTDTSGSNIDAWISARDLTDITVSNSAQQGPNHCFADVNTTFFYGDGFYPVEKVNTTTYKGCSVFFTTATAAGGTGLGKAKLTSTAFNIRAVIKDL